MTEVLLDALVDSLKVLPFILLVYILMELIESAKYKEKIESALIGKAAPLAAGLLGAIPECGFSVMCAKLYDERLIKSGTLIAALLSVSDEGLIILISSGVSADKILLFLAVKICYAVLAGMVINAFFCRRSAKHVCPEKHSCIECGIQHKNPWDRYLLHPLAHALKVFIYLLILNILLGVIIYKIGTENISAFMQASRGLQPLFAALVGVVPNCVSSMLVAKAYAAGVIAFPALISGLSASAGLGLVLLYKNGKKAYRNIGITAGLLLCALIIGYLTLLLGF